MIDEKSRPPAGPKKDLANRVYARRRAGDRRRAARPDADAGRLPRGRRQAAAPAPRPAGRARGGPLRRPRGRHDVARLRRRARRGRAHAGAARRRRLGRRRRRGVGRARVRGARRAVRARGDGGRRERRQGRAGARRRARAVARGRRVRRLDAVHLRVRSDGPRGEGREAHVSEVVLVPVGPDLPGGRVHRAELSRAARARARADGGVEGLDAAHVPAVPLLRPGPALQRHPRVHRGVRVDDRLRQFSLLPEDGQLRGRARVPDAVPAQLLRRRRVRRPAQRIHAVLHRAHAHALHALRLARAPDRQGPQRRRAGPRREGRLDPIAHGAALRRRGGL